MSIPEFFRSVPDVMSYSTMCFTKTNWITTQMHITLPYHCQTTYPVMISLTLPLRRSALWSVSPATQKISPTMVSETSSDTTVKFSKEDQFFKPPPLLTRNDSSDDNLLFRDSKSSIQSVRSIKTPLQLCEGNPYLIDSINHWDEW